MGVRIAGLSLLGTGSRRKFRQLGLVVVLDLLRTQDSVVDPQLGNQDPALQAKRHAHAVTLGLLGQPDLRTRVGIDPAKAEKFLIGEITF